MATKTGTYEALFLFGTAATADAEGAVKQIGDLVTKHGGEILLLKKWDERKLAYEVKKNKRGLYVLCFYKGPGASVAKITHDVNLSESILRVMITDASHLSLDEMNAQQPQQPVKERPRDEFNVPMGEFR
ncbi:MAG: 30S ribosomal protein S6 [Tepidisphaeraceae bacterium]